MSTYHTAARFLVQLPENSENYKNDQVCKFFNVTSDDAETVVRVEYLHDFGLLFLSLCCHIINVDLPLKLGLGKGIVVAMHPISLHH